MNFKDLGLSSAKLVYEDSMKNNYTIGAFNFNNVEQMQAIIEAGHETRSPIILQAAFGGVKHFRKEIFPYVVKGGVEYSKYLAKKDGVKPIPIILNLDHGADFKQCEICCSLGFSAIMIDGSHLPLEENIALTKRVVEMAKTYDPDICVEGELGIIGGEEDDLVSTKKDYTDPAVAARFIDETGIDILAISIGTSHGAKKFTEKDLVPNDKGEMVPPPLRKDIVDEIAKLKPNTPLVLHGASAIPQEFVKEFNEYGGTLEKAIGIPDEYVAELTSKNICKVNIHSDGRLVFMSQIRRGLAEKSDSIEERYFLGLGKEEMKEYYMYKMENVLMCADKVE